MSKSTTVQTGYTVQTLGREHMQAVADLFIKTFCDSEPVTKHLGIQHHEYEPFVLSVIQKAVKDGLSVVALDENNNVVACVISEDITDSFKPNLAQYPKMKPIFAIIEKLSSAFLNDKTFKKGKVAHSWIAMVDQSCRGKGLSTKIDLAATNHCAKKGFDFTYAEFTNDISENITHHYSVSKKLNEVTYDSFTLQGLTPFKGLEGAATSYILGIKPNVKLEDLKGCYTTKNS